MSTVTTLKQKALSVTGLDHVHLLSSVSSNACTMTVKSCAPRTAANMARLGVKCGWMLKRNEQRAWQPRFCCIVPHTFLYYFESPEAEVPRGVIDLEYYTEITADPANNVLMLSAAKGVPLRQFYLRTDDELAASEWISALHRERYRVVRDERDAYQGLQSDFSSQIEDVFSGLSEAVVEKDRVKEGLRAERSAARDHLSAARRLAMEVAGVAEADAEVMDMGDLLAAVGEAAAERQWQAEVAAERARAADARAAAGEEAVARQAEQLAANRAAAAEACAEAAAAVAAADDATAALAAERSRRADAEAAAEDLRRRLEEARLQAEQGQVNLGIVAGERRAAEAVAAELTEQKKVLVREVRAGRRALLEAKAVNERLAAAYESLERTLRLEAIARQTSSDGAQNSTNGAENSADGAQNSVDAPLPLLGWADKSASPTAAAGAAEGDDSAAALAGRELSKASFLPSPSTSSGTNSSFDAGSTSKCEAAEDNNNNISATPQLLVRDLTTGDLGAVSALPRPGDSCGGDGENSGDVDVASSVSGGSDDKNFLTLVVQDGLSAARLSGGLQLAAAWRRSSGSRRGGASAVVVSALVGAEGTEAAPAAVTAAAAAAGEVELAATSAAPASDAANSNALTPALESGGSSSGRRCAVRRRSGVIRVSDLDAAAPAAGVAAAAGREEGFSKAATASPTAALRQRALSPSSPQIGRERGGSTTSCGSSASGRSSGSGASEALPARSESDHAGSMTAAGERGVGGEGLSSPRIKVLCHRCGGTVEGPVFSTCQCKMPLLGENGSGVGGNLPPSQPTAAAAAAKSIVKFKGVLRSFGAALDSAAAQKLRAIGNGGSDLPAAGSGAASQEAGSTSNGCGTLAAPRPAEGLEAAV